AVPYIVTNSTFWRIGKDTGGRMLSDWRMGPLRNAKLKWWLKVLMRKRGGAAFVDLLDTIDENENIYLALVGRIPEEPRYLCYAEAADYRGSIQGGLALDVPAAEEVLKMQDKVVEEWRKRRPRGGDTYNIHQVAAAGRHAKASIAPPSESES